MLRVLAWSTSGIRLPEQFCLLRDLVLGNCFQRREDLLSPSIQAVHIIHVAESVSRSSAWQAHVRSA